MAHRLISLRSVALAASALAAVLLLAVTAEAAAHRTCGTFASETGQVKVVARGTTCVKAMQVARRYMNRAVWTSPWTCGLAHGPDAGRVLFSCGYGGTGDYRKMTHSIIASKAGSAPRSSRILECGDLTDAGIGIYNLTTRRVSCAGARRVARRYDSNPSTPRGYRCKTTRVRQYELDIRCTRSGGRVVRFQYVTD
jgi:hypothetical protein